jgi:hypothetical protein
MKIYPHFSLLRRVERERDKQEQRAVSGLILTHTSSSTRVVFQTKDIYLAKFFRVQTGRIPSWTYSKADVYRGTTVFTVS